MEKVNKKSKGIIAISLAIVFAFLLLPLQNNMQASAAEQPAKEQLNGEHLDDYTAKYGWDPITDVKPLTGNKKARSATPESINYLAVLVEFPDADMQNIHLDDQYTLKAADMVMNSGGMQTISTGNEIPVVSLKNYLNKYSYGALDVTTSFFPKNNGTVVSYTSQKPRSYYMKQSSTNPDGYTSGQQATREKELLTEILNAVGPSIEAEFNGADLDTNNDGYIDAISFFVEGKYIDSGIGWGDLLWSHKADGYFQNKISGKSIGKYNLNNVKDSKSVGGAFSNNSRMNPTVAVDDLKLDRASYSVIHHEFLHTLGLTDLYRGTSSGEPVGFYDIMAANNGQNPQAMLTVLSRDWLRWGSKIPEITADDQITLNRPTYANSSEKTSYKIFSPLNDKEYFIVEFYQKQSNTLATGRDDGVIVYRVNTNNGTNNGGGTDGLGDFLFVFRPGETSLGAAQGTLEDAVILPNAGNTYGKTLDQSGSTWDKDTLYFSDGKNSGVKLEVASSTANTITLNITVPQTLGSGTQADPYLISTASDWNNFVRDNKYVKIMKDIDFTGQTVTPISNFQGQVDGNGKTLFNITIQGGGLFQGISNGSIKDLSIENIQVTGEVNRHAGALAANIAGATIQNVAIKSGSVTGGDAPTYDSQGVGGFVGYFGDGTIENCYSSVSVANGRNLGGFIGLTSGGTVKDSFANGTVKKAAGNKSGGFYGSIFSTQNAVYTNCAYDMRATGHNTAQDGKDITGITGYQTPESLILDLGGVNELSLKIETKPLLSTVNAMVRFDSTGIADLNMDTQKIFGVSAGTTNLYVDIATGTNAMPLKTEVKVTDTSTPTKPITGVTVVPTALLMEQGTTSTVAATVAPTDTTDVKTIAWSSDNTAVATVNATTGEVTAVAPGIANIIATTVNGKTAACTITVKIGATGVQPSTNNVSLQVGNEQTITANLLPADTTDTATYTYSSADTSIATADNTGKITGVSAGHTTVTVTATLGDGTTFTASVAVEVSAVPKPLTGLTVDTASLEMERGTTSQALVVGYVPADTTDDKSITWESDNTNVATVDANGVVTAVAAGNATITAKGANNTTATCAVTVKVGVTGVLPSTNNVTLQAGNEQTITASLLPADTTDTATYTYSSTDTSIATADNTGKITGISAGNTTVTVTATLGDGTTTFTAHVAVTVTPVPKPITGVTVTPTTLTLDRGTTQILTAEVTPADTTDITTITWSSNNTAVAEVNAATGEVKAVGQGTATITATTSNGVTATCAVTVKVPSTSISLSTNNVSLIKGQDQTVIASLLPADTTDAAVFTWTSADPTIATVDNTGKITAVNVGTTKITVNAAITRSITLTSTIHVTVTPTAFGRLEAKHDEVQNAIANGLYNGAPQSFIKALNTALETANGYITAGEGANTDVDYNNAHDDLAKQLNLFTYVDALIEMQSLVDTDITPYDTDTTAAFLAKKALAEQILLDPIASLDRINTVLAELKAAHDAMVPLNSAVLELEITLSQGVNLQAYLDGAVKDAFTDQLEKAQTVLANATTNAEYQTALDALVQARQNLEAVKKATDEQKTAVQAGIIELNALLVNYNYSDINRAQIESAIANAQTALLNANLTNDQANAILNAILKAKELNPEQNNNNMGGGNNNQGNGQGGTGSGNNSQGGNQSNSQSGQSSQDQSKEMNAQTGDNTALWIVIAVMVVSLFGIGIVILIKLKAKREEQI